MLSHDHHGFAVGSPYADKVSAREASASSADISLFPLIPPGLRQDFFNNGQDREPIFGLFTAATDTYPCYIRHRSI
jgi:hypothetical protein